MDAAARLLVCASSAVEDSGKGMRFPVTAFHYQATGFVVRHGGKVYGYLNQCAHVPVELDWMEGEFFESSKTFIMCATHGAIYVPETGYCAGGPCKGGRLRSIEVSEEDGNIYWHPNEFIKPPGESK